MLRVKSTLPAEVEALVTRVIGCCIAVHRELGPGLLEMSYARALQLELEANGLDYECEKPVAVNYKGKPVCVHYIDLIVAKEIIVELKAVERLVPVYRSQLLNYLHITHLRIGLLINFNVPLLADGIKRVVL